MGRMGVLLGLEVGLGGEREGGFGLGFVFCGEVLKWWDVG